MLRKINGLPYLPLILSGMGILLSFFLIPREIVAVEEHILGFPDTDIAGHKLRPWLLGVLCLTPAAAAWLYHFSGILDRYLTRNFLSAFGLCMTALVGIFVLSDLQNNASDFFSSEKPVDVLASYYGIFIPSTMIMILPYGLMLSLLFCLGKMSRHQEIVAMVQTGRGVFRIVAPLIVAGIFCCIISLIFNYHWSPSAVSQQDFIKDKAKDGSASKARSVLYHSGDERRTWLVGAFPYDFEKSGTVENVLVRSFDDEGLIKSQLEAKKATWLRDKKIWVFDEASFINQSTKPLPTFLKKNTQITRNWQETPWQIVKPGLNHKHLGVPELNSWLAENHDVEWANQSPYFTQWHYRFSQPFICLVVVLLATALGIVFSRRGIGGGVSIALFLCLGMFFFSDVCLTFGEAGKIPPMLSAWLTNIIFSVVAIYLFNRRVTGRPIYDSLKCMFARKN